MTITEAVAKLTEHPYIYMPAGRRPKFARIRRPRTGYELIAGEHGRIYWRDTRKGYSCPLSEWWASDVYTMTVQNILATDWELCK